MLEVCLLLFQRILMTLEAALNIFLSFSSNTSRKNPVLITNRTHPIWSIFLYFAVPLTLSHYFSFILWSSSSCHSGSGLSIRFYIGVFGFYFNFCSKDLHCELERREENEERFSFKQAYFTISIVFFCSDSTNLSLLFFPLCTSIKWMKNLFYSLFAITPFSWKFFISGFEECLCAKQSDTFVNTLGMTAIYPGLHKVSQRTEGRKDDHLCALLIVRSELFFLYPDDMLETTVSETTLFPFTGNPAT